MVGGGSSEDPGSQGAHPVGGVRECNSLRQGQPTVWLIDWAGVASGLIETPDGCGLGTPGTPLTDALSVEMTFAARFVMSVPTSGANE